MNIESLIKYGITVLQEESASKDYRLDSEILLAHVLQQNREYLHTWPLKNIESSQVEEYKKLIERRKNKEPVAYITGKKEFWSLDLNVTKDVLIPRPDTEILIESALKLIPDNSENSKAFNDLKQTEQHQQPKQLNQHNQPEHSILPIKILDLGTGSGAIALAVAQERPNAIVYAVDNNNKTLEVAKSNALKLGIRNVKFYLGNWFSAFKDLNIKFDFILSNPPYIAQDDPHLITEDIQHEPKSALISNDNGLFDLKTIIQNSKNYLTHGGWLLLEHGYNQAYSVREYFSTNKYTNVATIKDYNQTERVTQGLYTYTRTTSV